MFPLAYHGGTPQARICKSVRFLIALRKQWTRQPSQFHPRHRPRCGSAAFGVHVFTALGAGIALIAMLEAVREHWVNMFGWLGVALIIDAIDGPMARKLDVVRLQPDWSGDILDLVVDFVTYVFVPAYAITASGMLLPLAAPVLGIGIVTSSALYFADRRMKAADNHFRGFPALWNVAAFYLFLLHLPPALSTLGVAVLIALTFAPFHVLHPIRVVRLRWLTLWLLGAGVVLAILYTRLRLRRGRPCHRPGFARSPPMSSAATPRSGK